MYYILYIYTSTVDWPDKPHLNHMLSSPHPACQVPKEPSKEPSPSDSRPAPLAPLVAAAGNEFRRLDTSQMDPEDKSFQYHMFKMSFSCT